MVKKALLIFIITNMVFAENDISADLAYQLVLDKINKKAVPVSFLNDVFKSSSIEKHMEIPERFAKPYEKKSWEQYKKLFIKESRIVAGVKFYSENKDLIMKVAEKYNVNIVFIISAGSSSKI